MPKYILALDQGTTSSRAVLFNENGRMVAIEQQEFTQLFPQPGWVEQNPMEIWHTQLRVAQSVIKNNGIEPAEIEAIGITNQRETTLVWDRFSGEPLCNAIVWQDRRTADFCEKLKLDGHEEYIRRETGLVADAYFSGTKLKWILDNVPGARAKSEDGSLCFGTVDSWLLWRLTAGKVHATDYTNASRTLLFNIRNLDWDQKMLEMLSVPRGILPVVRDSSAMYGWTEADFFGIPLRIAGIAGDQQAALFGQLCLSKGMAKNTYGTGCFLLMNTGTHLIQSKSGLISTIAWSIGGRVTYALEGSVFIAGAAIQWLRDSLKLIDAAPDTAYFATKVSDNGGVYVVPAFSGLGAPYWDMYARGAIFGLTRGTTKSHLIRATVESLAYQSKDVLDAMAMDVETPLTRLRVDGGASANDLLMQFQADILNVQVDRPACIETTALGAAYLAGIAVGFWKLDDLEHNYQIQRTFSPNMEETTRSSLYKGWQKAVKRTMEWAKDD